MRYKSINEQNKIFIEIIKQNEDLINILDYLDELELPNFYIAAGSVFQTIWNYYDNKSLNYKIKDIDIIYYDSNNGSKPMNTTFNGKRPMKSIDGTNYTNVTTNVTQYTGNNIYMFHLNAVSESQDVVNGLYSDVIIGTGTTQETAVSPWLRVLGGERHREPASARLLGKAHDEQGHRSRARHSD